ncbi:hypothetical protein EOS_00900 [Caballeronia mineralivorans PML1(12)]|uniref:UDP-N-acetylglucosamine 2-epimerase domain-containing protein n=2 Tax=Caballeronia mineralivorans TaxID=2010198 RepID=A0A0J1D634_9BURK|nr:hypothetical protein EOS_00900 [Caballeronia mineralivorans PML1(12)]
MRGATYGGSRNRTPAPAKDDARGNVDPDSSKPCAATDDCFFSAPLLDNEATVGLVAIEKVLADLDGHMPLTLLVKPHPRELMWPWRNWISAMEQQSGGIRLRLVENMSAAEILGSVDAVIGLSASVLIEAAFAGIPVLALQFAEPQRHENSAIETYLKGRIARSPKELRSRISELFVRIGQSSRIVDTPVTISADRKAMKAIELTAAGR